MSKLLADDLNTLRIKDVDDCFWLRGQRRTFTWGDGSIIQAERAEDGRRLILHYSYGDRNVDLPIALTKSPCHLGGERLWFICPLEVLGAPCSRRVGTLFAVRGLFGCRHCHRLGYRSQLLN
jgi:hypothetical protein